MIFRKLIGIAVVFACVLACVPNALGQAEARLGGAPKGGPKAGPSDRGAAMSKEPIHIKADKMVAQMEKKEIIAEGHVVITRGTFKITCERAIAYLEGNTDADNLVESITRLVAMKNVHIFDVEQGVKGRGEKAIYNRKTEIMELLGPPRPVVKRGGGVYSADRIIYNRTTGQFTLDGNGEVEIEQPGAEGQSRAVPMPRRPAPAKPAPAKPAPAPAARVSPEKPPVGARVDRVRIGS